ncbi:MAG: mycofactocin system FadH/OYE family oxidoreductase 2 [Acidimicrobiales bacterium]
MPGSQYRYLFSPLKLGPVTVSNRIVFAAHLTNYAEHGKPSEQHAAYYAARAAGGAGLIITEEHSVHPTDWPYEKMIHGFHDDVVPGYRRITEAVHAHGVPIFAQINHNGGQASSMYTRLPVWGPSPVADPLFREVPKAIDHGEIAEVVAGYADVAARCKLGGFDGIELQCSHSSIVRGFLSRATNHRIDDYGGSLENRARLLHEIVAAVREAIGRDLALGVRLCGDELIEHGITIDETVEVAQAVEDQGLVDYINTSIGVATASLFMIEASMHIPPEYALFIPSALRKAVDLPVVGVGRFKDPLQAERALAQGHADLIGVVRGQIADADFAAKARAGSHHDIRLCLSCNQECVGRMGLNRWLGCIENPATGREALLTGGSTGQVGQAGQAVALRPRAPTRVVVVGGGPGGLQAAIAAARSGHQVTVLERDDEAGGQVRWAARVPNRAEFGDLVRNQVHECGLLGVEIRTGTEATVELIDGLRPDAVVVATGSTPARPWWAPPMPTPGPGGEPEVEPDQGVLPVIDVTDVVTGRFSPSGHVIVIDEVGFHQATSVAELLADRGCRVEVLSPGMVVGQDLGITLDMENWWLRASSKGIEQVPDSVIVGLEDGALQVLHHPTGVTTPRTADWIVLAVPGAPADELYFALRERYSAAADAAGGEAREVTVERVGDCVAPRRAHAAVIEGNRVGSAL